MAEALRVELCGGFSVGLGGRRIEDRLAGRQGREVFGYLTLNRHRSVSRDELCALLWPERAPRAPEAALNTILARLRRVLGHAILPSRAQLTLELPPGSWIDVESAEQAAERSEALLAEGSAGAALDLARTGRELVSAPLLPDVQHPWVEHRRSEVEDLGSRLLMAIARCGLALGGASVEEAERAARRFVEREPFRESGYALLMKAHAARGDVAEALLVFERLRTILRDELGISPSGRVMSLYERLLRDGAATIVNGRGASGPEHPETSTPLPPALARGADKPLVGRGRELRALTECWHALDEDPRRVIGLAGEPGIGKTMLASAFARVVHRQGALVLYGQAVEEAIVAYAPIVEALRHYVVHAPVGELERALGIHLGELAWLIPELADHRRDRRVPAGDPRLERMRLYHAVAALVAHAASQRPVVLVLDDMQWADTDTLLLVRQLLRETTRRPILALLTYRDSEVGGEHPVSRLLGALRRDLSITRMVLRGLTADGVAELVASSDQLRGELLELLRAHTSGNPFFVEEVARSLDETRAAGSGEISIDDLLVLPEGVREVIQDRLRRLEQPARDALGAAAVLGQAFPRQLLEDMVEPDALRALDSAVRAGLVTGEGDHGELYRFRHALAREAIYHGLGRVRRSELHLQAGRALERRRQSHDVEAAELAHHYVESGRPEVAEMAIAYSQRAAVRALMTYAYDDAAQHYRRALEVVERHRPRDTATQCELLLRLGEVCWQGSGPSARVIFEQAAAVAHGRGEYDKFAEAMLGLGGRFYAPTTADEPYVQLLEEALPGVRSDDHLHSRVLGRLAEHVMLIDAGRAARLSEEAVAIARRVGHPDLLLAALLSRHGALLHIQHVDERRRLAIEAVDIAGRLGSADLEALAHHWLLYDLLELGDVGAAERAQRRLAQLAEQLRQPLFRHSALVWQRILEVLAGHFDRAAQLAHEALNLARSADGAAQTHFLAQQLALACDLGGADKLLPAISQRAGTGDALWAAAARLLADVAEPAAEHGGADRLAASRLPDLPRNVFWLTTLAWMAEASARAADHERAAVIYDLLQCHAHRFVQLTFDGSFGSVHRYLGLLAGALGRSRQASEHFDEAVHRHAALPAPALHARTLCDYAEAVTAGRAAGSDAAVARMLDESLRLAKGSGASWTLARLRRDSVAALRPAPLPR